MKYILAIGNSFSRDATAYLYDICKSLGEEVNVVNLYIGGCSLERHWDNIEHDKAEYQYQENGIETDRYVSVKEVLHRQKWDYIVTQQSSHDSGWLDTYEPFTGLILDYLKKEVPAAKIFFQQTWAYEKDSDHGCFIRYNRDQEEMYRRSWQCYHTITDKYSLPLIPCGDVIQSLRAQSPFDYDHGGRSLCRDGFHMHYIYGRYALALTWAGFILGIDVLGCSYVPTPYETDEKADESLLKIVREQVASTLTTSGV